MNSLILKIAVRILYPVMLIVSLLVLLRGHHLPGGGFIGGLIAASAIIFRTFVEGIENTERKIYIKPFMLIVSGLFIAFIASVIPLLSGMSFFQGVWTDFYLPLAGKPGTPLLFDLGVYLLVPGVVSQIVFSIGD